MAKQQWWDKPEFAQVLGNPQATVQPTGGTPGKINPMNPVKTINTTEGTKMLHEGELQVTSPDGKFAIIPSSMIGTEGLKAMEKQTKMGGFATGGTGSLTLQNSTNGVRNPIAPIATGGAGSLTLQNSTNGAGNPIAPIVTDGTGSLTPHGVGNSIAPFVTPDPVAPITQQAPATGGLNLPQTPITPITTTPTAATAPVNPAAPVYAQTQAQKDQAAALQYQRDQLAGKPSAAAQAAIQTQGASGAASKEALMQQMAMLKASPEAQTASGIAQQRDIESKLAGLEANLSDSGKAGQQTASSTLLTNAQQAINATFQSLTAQYNAALTTANANPTEENKQQVKDLITKLQDPQYETVGGGSTFQSPNLDNIGQSANNPTTIATNMLNNNMFSSQYTSNPQFKEQLTSEIQNAIAMGGKVDASGNLIIDKNFTQPWLDPKYASQYTDWNGNEIGAGETSDPNQFADVAGNGTDYVDANGKKVSFADLQSKWDSIESTHPAALDDYIDSTTGKIDTKAFMDDYFGKSSNGSVPLTDMTDIHKAMSTPQMTKAWNDGFTDSNGKASVAVSSLLPLLGAASSGYFYDTGGNKLSNAMDASTLNSVYAQFSNTLNGGKPMNATDFAAAIQGGHWFIDEDGVVQNFTNGSQYGLKPAGSTSWSDYSVNKPEMYGAVASVASKLASSPKSYTEKQGRGSGLSKAGQDLVNQLVGHTMELDDGKGGTTKLLVNTMVIRNSGISSSTGGFKFSDPSNASRTGYAWLDNSGHLHYQWDDLPGQTQTYKSSATGFQYQA